MTFFFYFILFGSKKLGKISLYFLPIYLSLFLSIYRFIYLFYDYEKQNKIKKKLMNIFLPERERKKKLYLLTDKEFYLLITSSTFFFLNKKKKKKKKNFVLFLFSLTHETHTKQTNLWKIKKKKIESPYNISYGLISKGQFSERLTSIHFTEGLLFFFFFFFFLHFLFN